MTRTCTTRLGRTIQLAPARPAKRVADCLLAAFFILLTSPVMLLTALLVKLTSRGPVLYRDERLGMGGRPYPMLKFRSMKVGAPPAQTDAGKLVVHKRDPRLTAIGRPLRILRLDELPQLFNVLMGDMALVGPRAGQARYEDTYSDLAYERLRLRPGCTGLGTVVGGRHMTNDTLYAVEARYVERQSPMLDLLILLTTPLYVLTGPGLPRRILRRYLQDLPLVSVADDASDR